MPHVLVVKAQEVLANKDSYPNIVWLYAQQMVDYSNNKRAAMSVMWSNRSILHKWINVWCDLPDTYNSIHKRNVKTTSELKKILSSDDMQVLYIFRQYIGRTYTTNAMLFLLFESMMKLVECTDYTKMLRYIECVNGKVHDNTLQDVSFLHTCNHSHAAEILAWKLLKCTN